MAAIRLFVTYNIQNTLGVNPCNPLPKLSLPT